MTSKITVLSGMDHIRLRSGMYVGDAFTPETLLKEIIDNAIDELLNNHCDRVEIDYDHKEGWYRVRDNGRGLPLGKFHTDDPEMKSLDGHNATRVIFTNLYSGGKFDKDNYKYSTGLNGLGLTICNALSKSMEVRVKDTKNVFDGKYYKLVMSEGKVLSEEALDPSEIDGDHWWSTEVTIWPDETIFKSLKTSPKELQLQLARLSKPDSVIKINGTEIKPFSFTESVESDILHGKIIKTSIELGSVNFEVMLAWSSKDFESAQRGAVNLGQANDGYHLRESRYAVGRAVASLDGSLAATDANYGLRIFVNAFLAYPSYSSQTKERLSWINDFDTHNISLARSKYAHLITINPTNGKEDLRAAMGAAKSDPEYQDPAKFFSMLEDQVKRALRKDEAYSELLVKRLIDYKKLTQKLSDNAYIDSIVKTGNNRITKNAVEGIYEARSADRKSCELFICEGKSALGGLLQTRNSNTQAMLPLRGKPLNAGKKADIKEILENREMITLVNGIGTGIYPRVNIEEARYGKIIIVTDADFDGYNIEALVIGALAYLTPEVISSGLLYVAETPLYKQDGKLIYKEEDLVPGKKFKRFKGLGSMVPEDLGMAVLDPSTRRLHKVTMNTSREKILDIIVSAYEKKRIMIESGMLVE